MDWILRSVGDVARVVEQGVKVVESELERLDAGVRSIINASEDEGGGGDGAATPPTAAAGPDALADTDTVAVVVHLDVLSLELTEEMVAFVDRIAAVPAAPSTSKFTYAAYAAIHRQGFALTAAEQGHAVLILKASPVLAALRYRITPQVMSESKFWELYFHYLREFVQSQPSPFTSISNIVDPHEDNERSSKPTAVAPVPVPVPVPAPSPAPQVTSLTQPAAPSPKKIRPATTSAPPAAAAAVIKVPLSPTTTTTGQSSAPSMDKLAVPTSCANGRASPRVGKAVSDDFYEVSIDDLRRESPLDENDDFVHV